MCSKLSFIGHLKGKLKLERWPDKGGESEAQMISVIFVKFHFCTIFCLVSYCASMQLPEEEEGRKQGSANE